MSGTADDDVMMFADEEVGVPAPAHDALPPWRILIVDDNEEVHKATQISLRDTTYQRRGIEFLNAYSAQQGSATLRHTEDIALVLLDVVMETQDAGLRLARHVREDLGNHAVQIVLRTGQPGDAPERKVIVDYEINDYKSKSELTGTQLYTTVIGALRAYEVLQNARRQHTELLAAASKVKDLEAALDQHAIVAITDPRGRIVHANDKFCHIAKMRREQLVGHDHRQINAGVHPDAFFKDLWDTITAGRIWKGEICNCASDGSLYWSAVTIVPFLKPDGKCYQYISIGTDITERKHSEQALRETEERWKYALDGAGDGVWDVNFDSGKVIFSQRWKQMNGYGDEAFELRLEGWKGLIHPDDLGQVEADMRAYLVGKTASYSNEHRTRCKDGSWKWVHDRGMVVTRGESGRPLRMVGTHTDITERKGEQQRLQGAARQFREVLASAPVAACIKRRLDGAIVFSNAAYARLFALDAGGVAESDMGASFVDPAEAAALMGALAAGSPIAARTVQLKGENGAPRSTMVTAYPIDYDGAPAMVSWFA
ncbi:MAG: PAS domain-containing protein [Pseudomonadota bacterium]